MFLCTKCFSIFRRYPNHIPRYHEEDNTNPCLNKECNGKVVEVDEAIIVAIRELNLKGYKSEYSCAGHINTHAAYISFKIHEIAIDITTIEIPKGWKADKWNACKSDVYFIRYITVNEDILKKQKELNLAMDNLIDWVISLPNLNLGEER